MSETHQRKFIEKRLANQQSATGYVVILSEVFGAKNPNDLSKRVALGDISMTELFCGRTAKAQRAES